MVAIDHFIFLVSLHITEILTYLTRTQNTFITTSNVDYFICNKHTLSENAVHHDVRERQLYSSVIFLLDSNFQV